MQVSTIAQPHTHIVKPPPLWFVTNGDITVGPVTTNLLVRGVLHEKVPRDCMVRERTWSAWRNVERIREVAALRRAQARGTILVEKARWREQPACAPLLEALERTLLRARDPAEVLLECLIEAMRATGACVGATHRRSAPYAGLVTTSVLGPGMSRKLGRAVGADDPVALLAARGGTLCEEPRAYAASGCVRDRLGALPACNGVAMVPIACAGRLYAIIELGRPDHAFRELDFGRLIAIAGVAEDRLGVVRNTTQATSLCV